jgi:hypothetical protein
MLSLGSITQGGTMVKVRTRIIVLMLLISLLSGISSTFAQGGGLDRLQLAIVSAAMQDLGGKVGKTITPSDGNWNMNSTPVSKSRKSASRGISST